MITACKAYITNNDTATIWEQDQNTVAEKLKAAIRLNEVLATWLESSCLGSEEYFCFFLPLLDGLLYKGVDG